MNQKEKIKDFNQCFLTLMNMIPEDSMPSTNVLIEFYTTYVPLNIIIFVKRDGKNTLPETFEEM
jgi:hypothetical protein